MFFLSGFDAEDVEATTALQDNTRYDAYESEESDMYLTDDER